MAIDRRKYLYRIKRLEIKSWLKYLMIEGKSVVDYVLGELMTGTEITIGNTVEKKFYKFDVKGNSIQDGTPTPASPVEILSSGDNGTISEKIVNKNLFDTNNLTNGYLTASGTITATNQYRVSDYIDVSSSLYVTISGSAGASEYNCFYDVNKNFVGKNNMGTNTTKTITVPSNAMYIRCTVKKENIDTYQVELNSTATTYTAHQEQTYTIPCQQPMRSIGTVRDEFIKVNGEWKERHNIAFIESYNGETITTNYMSTTGGLDIGASIQYVLENPTDLPCTSEQIAILENLPKSYNEQTNIYSLDVTPAYIEAQAYVKKEEE